MNEKLIELRAEVYWLRIFTCWLKSSRLKRFLFRKALNRFNNSLEEREKKLNKSNITV